MRQIEPFCSPKIPMLKSGSMANAHTMEGRLTF